MTTIATDGRSMAGDGQIADQFDTVLDTARAKVHRLSNGSVVGGAGNSFDLLSWRNWLEAGKQGDCPISDERFAGLILSTDGVILWVDHKGREIEVPGPCAIGSGQDFAIGAMEAGATPEEAVRIACKRDSGTGGAVIALEPATPMLAVA